MVNVPKNNQWSLVCLIYNIHVYAVLQTWVVVKYDIKKVLVTPRDIEFILLEKGHQNFLPLQCNCCHVVLQGKIQHSQEASYNLHYESINLQFWKKYDYVPMLHQLTETVKSPNEGCSLRWFQKNYKSDLSWWILVVQLLLRQLLVFNYLTMSKSHTSLHVSVMSWM